MPLSADPTNPASLPDFPFVSSIDQTSVTLTFSFTKTCTVNYTLVNQPIGYGPGNWTTLPNPQQKLDPLKTGASVNGSVLVLAGKVARVTVGGLAPNQGYLLLVSAVDQYGNQAQAVPGAALRTRDVTKSAGMKKPFLNSLIIAACIECELLSLLLGFEDRLEAQSLDQITLVGSMQRKVTAKTRFEDSAEPSCGHGIRSRSVEKLESRFVGCKRFSCAFSQLICHSPA